jgi:hypothetical protein
MSLYTHWVCFDCRKSFHARPAVENNPAVRKCPECTTVVCDMGIYFEPPPSRAKRAWAIMELLSRSGYRFQTEGSKAFIDAFILITRRPTLEGVRRRVDVLRQELEEGRMKTRLKGYKEERKGRRKRLTN